jgi:Uma2 family endonuclease
MAEKLAQPPLVPTVIAPTEEAWRAMTPAAREAWLIKPPLVPTVIAPTEEAWRAMTPAAREAWLIWLIDALDDPAAAMGEGRRHKKAKSAAIDALGLHFGAIGRSVYLAEEMNVVYPGEPVFTPDVLAVVGVAEPEDDPRMAWVVADEGRGLDLVMEVLHHGDRKKDLVSNVERYAGLGIPEYFVYDRLHQQILGYRLPDARARRYQRIVPQFGRHTSAVLGLDLAIQGNRLRFFYGMAELPGTGELIGRLNDMVAGLEARAEASQTEIQEAQAQAQEAQAQVQAQAQAAQAQAQAAQAQAQAALRETLVALLGARGIVCSDEGRARLDRCTDLATLRGWLLRAASAATEEAVFAS